MKFSLKESFGALTRFEWGLWIVSLVVVTASFLLSPVPDYFTLGTSLIGVTALIFISKGMLLGQVLTLVFSTLYGVISYHYAYYGEVLTYVGMTAPMAIIALVSWARHPYKESAEVEVARITGRQIVILTLLTIAVTVLFYFILRALGTANLLTSTLSVTTSFLAVYLTYLRSPYYAIGYAANDIVLTVLWIMAAFDNPAYLPMVFCFVMFLVNDIYGFINWRRMQRRQQENE
ncbi:MAG: nicotinamide mononucleotide transporter [Tidjanibacter sp.]|nr:nicotinamide mononucleotide transporter [Tidjanibacter sp.]MBQ5931957.1 nicotinamide mononucleotide transporter [Tidjanibacter sp.]